MAKRKNQNNSFEIVKKAKIEEEEKPEVTQPKVQKKQNKNKKIKNKGKKDVENKDGNNVILYILFKI